MLTKKLLAAAAGVALLAALSGCAVTASVAEPHQHLRDAKQGSTLPAPAPSATPRKPLHDHREMK